MNSKYPDILATPDSLPLNDLFTSSDLTDRVLLVGPGEPGWEAQQVLLGAESACFGSDRQVVSVPLPTGAPFGQRWPRMRRILRTIPHFGSVHLVIPPMAASAIGWWPLVLAARFYGCRITVDLRFSLAELLIEEMPAGFKRLLRRAHLVLVDHEPLAARMGRQQIRALTRPLIVDDQAAPDGKATSALQPHMLAILAGSRNPDVIKHSLGYLTRALILVKQKYPRTQLTVLAEDIDRQMAVEMAEVNGLRLIPLTNEFDLAECFSQADVFVNALAVGNPAPLVIRAMQHGLVVVSTAVGAIPRFIDDGRNGRLVGLSRPENMADAVIQLVETPELVVQFRERVGATLKSLLGPQV